MDNWIIKETVDFLRPEAHSQDKTPFVLMLPGDNKGHTWEITCYKGGEPADLTGCAVNGYFLRSDNVMVTVKGSVNGNVVTVTFSPQCYACSGGMRGAIRIDKSNQIVTLKESPFIVRPPLDSDQVINGGDAIPDLATLLAQIHTLEQATNAAMLSLGVGGLTIIDYIEDDETIVLGKVPLTDDAAYETAVSMGYEGTEEDWEAFTALITTNSAAITQAQEDAAEAIRIAQQGLSASESIMIPPESWTGDSAPFTAEVNCTIATANNRIIVGIGGSMTTQEQAAISSASVMCTAQAAGKLTFVAYQNKPTIAIPINVMEVK